MIQTLVDISHKRHHASDLRITGQWVDHVSIHRHYPAHASMCRHTIGNVCSAHAYVMPRSPSTFHSSRMPVQKALYDGADFNISGVCCHTMAPRCLKHRFPRSRRHLGTRKLLLWLRRVGLEAADCTCSHKFWTLTGTRPPKWSQAMINLYPMTEIPCTIKE